MGVVQERYTAILLGVNETLTTTSGSLGGFLCKTAGTVTVTSHTGRLLIDAFPVSAGVYSPMPFYMGGPGATITLAGGASGTIATF